MYAHLNNKILFQIDDEQFKKILSYIDIGQKEGAKLVCGGKTVGSEGYFIQPTIFADVKEDMKIAQEEVNLDI